LDSYKEGGLGMAFVLAVLFVVEPTHFL